jgi:hypothetical protein
MIISFKEILYLEWIFNRLVYRFKDDAFDLETSKNILSKIKKPNFNIDDDILDKIISKYYVDFYLDKNNNIGFTDAERSNLRSTIKNLVDDVIHKRVPEKHTIIK